MESPDTSPSSNVQVLWTEDQHWETVIKMASMADEILVSSFGLWGGIMHDGTDVVKKYGHENRVQEFLNVCPPKTTILIGLEDLPPCVGNCPHCAALKVKKQQRIAQHMQRWPQFQWRVVTNLHYKAYCFRKADNWCAVVGGRNLTNSDWFDASFLVFGQTAKDAVDMLAQAWAGCQPHSAFNAVKP